MIKTVRKKLFAHRIDGLYYRNEHLESLLRETNLHGLVHTDLCGFKRTESLNKAKYFVTFIDDSTQICDVKFLNRKSDLLGSVKNYKTIIVIENRNMTKCLQSFSGKEYRKAELYLYLVECGFSRRYTVLFLFCNKTG